MGKENEVEIDLLDLARYLKKKIWIIISICVVCALGGLISSQFFMTSQYTASTRVYVLNRSNENNVVYSDFQISSQLLNDYKVLITGQNVTKEVVNKLGLNMKAEKLAKKIRVTAPNDTRVLQISVTDTNPQRAADIANAVREIASQQIEKIMAVDAVNVVYEADVPDSPSSPNVKRNAVLAAVLGGIVSVVILTIICVSDDTIRTEEDVERYLGLSTLGVIPASVDFTISKQQQTKKRKGIM